MSRRTLLSGLVGIAVLLTASLAALRWLDAAQGQAAPRPAVESPAAPAPVAAPEAQPPLAPIPPPPPPAPAPVQGAPKGNFQPSVRGLPEAPAGAEWASVPMALRAADLGPLAAAVHASLGEARKAMAPCFQAEDAREAKAPPRPADATTEDDAGPAVLVLRLEARERGLDVVGADVERLGGSSRAFAACAAQVLDRWAISAERAVPGKRYRLKFPLQ